MLIYIEERRRCFFGLIQLSDQIYLLKAFKLRDNDSFPKHRDEVVIGGMYVGCQWEYRNMDTFNLKSEIDILYASFLDSLKRAENKQKQIDNFINSID